MDKRDFRVPQHTCYYYTYYYHYWWTPFPLTYYCCCCVIIWILRTRILHLSKNEKRIRIKVQRTHRVHNKYVKQILSYIIYTNTLKLYYINVYEYYLIIITTTTTSGRDFTIIWDYRNFGQWCTYIIIT